MTNRSRSLQIVFGLSEDPNRYACVNKSKTERCSSIILETLFGESVDVCIESLRGARNQVMQGYRKGKFQILLATDVAARGIDVDDVEAVINYDLPNENEYYLHRIGRTGRAKRHGVAFTLLTYTESVRFDTILKYIMASPVPLKFDDMGVLVNENNEPFFDDM